MQQKFRPIRATLSLALIAIVASCTADSNDLSAPLDNAVLQNLQVQPISEEDAQLREFTRQLAISLGSDPALRTRLGTSLSTSPYREEKRHLRTLITQSEPAMLTGIARAGNRSVESVAGSLGGIIDLEIYLPVEEHRSRWRGGSELIVAGALADDSSLPIHAFDLTGNPIALSWDGPPKTPVLAVVPVETDFSDPRESGIVELSGTTGGVESLSMPSASVVMKRAEIRGDWEGWLMGDPEFEVHVTDEGGTYVSCAGARKGSPLKFAMNDEVWTGEVMLEPDYSPGTRFFEMWEDDSDPCKGENDGVRPKTSSNIKDIAKSTATSAVKVYEAANDSSWLKKLEAVAEFVSLVHVVSGVHKDDLVGRITIPSNCWPTPNGQPTFSMLRGGTVNGTARIEFRMTGDRDPICPPNPYIAGPSVIEQGTNGTWTANVTKGVSPYTYTWYRDGQQVGTGSSYSWSVGVQNFSLRVEVADSHSPSRTQSNTTQVLVNGCPPPAIEC